ncbi:hypothetical protein [Achromobacter kerstersii]
MSTMHFYTTRTDEPGSGWVAEGITAYVYAREVSSSVPLHRWRHPVSNLHFYTTDPTGERAPEAGYVYEWIECYVPMAPVDGTVSLYRWFNGETGDHLYTLDKSGELGPSSGYVDEGVACFVFSSEAADTTALYRWVAGDQTYCIQLSRNNQVVYSKNVHVATYAAAAALSAQIFSQYNEIQLRNGMPPADRAENPKLGGC